MAQRLPAKDAACRCCSTAAPIGLAPCGVPCPLKGRARFVLALAALTPPRPGISSHALMRPSIRSVAHAPGNTLHQLGVRYLAEVVREVRINHFVAAPVQPTMDPSDRVLGASGPAGIRLLRLQVRLEDRRQHQPSPTSGATRSIRHGMPRHNFPGCFFGMSPVSPDSAYLPQVPRQFPDPAFHSVRLDVRDRDTTTPAAPPLRRASAHAASRKSSRHTLSTRACRRPGSSFAFACSDGLEWRTLADPGRLPSVVMSLPPFRTVPNSGPLSSAGITPRLQYYGPIRHPAIRPAPRGVPVAACHGTGGASRVATHSIFARADATTPAETSRLSRRSLSGQSAAFPFPTKGRPPAFDVSRPVGVHSRFGPRGR